MRQTKQRSCEVALLSAGIISAAQHRHHLPLASAFGVAIMSAIAALLSPCFCAGSGNSIWPFVEWAAVLQMPCSHPVSSAVAGNAGDRVGCTADKAGHWRSWKVGPSYASPVGAACPSRMNALVNAARGAQPQTCWIAS